MRVWNFALQAAFATAVGAAFATSGLADDCSVVKNAMLNSGHTPHSVTVTAVDGQGKKVVGRLIQTVTDKYVQTPDGKWYSLGIAIKDLEDDTGTLLTCRRSGSDSVNGESAAAYDVHGNLEGEVQDQKVWLSSTGRVLKTERMQHGALYTAEYDFNHFASPAGAVPMGGK